MTTTTLSPQALTIIDAYEHLKIGEKTVNCPYFNNRTTNLRGALRVLVGKGAPKEIIDEAQVIALREKITLNNLDENDLVKFLIDHHLGIDCAGFAYYILDAEMKQTKNKKLKQILSFQSKGPLRRLIARFRTIENTNVLILQENSVEISIEKLSPGDLIIATGGGVRHDYNHVLVITSVTRDTSKKIHSIEYAHSYTWKNEGKYTKGIRRGTIYIRKSSMTILEQEWSENEKKDMDNETWNYMKTASKVTCRRLHTI